MIYLQVPADVYRALYQVLKSIGCADYIRWLQIDYAGEIRPTVTYVKGKLTLERLEGGGVDAKAGELIRLMIGDLYGK